MADCWSCGAERGDDPLCSTCQRVQPPSPRRDDFAALGLPRRMDIDRAALDRAFRDRSKRLHPDRFPREDREQRRFALAQTERVNQAYKRLRDPRGRGEHLLELECGVPVAGETERTEDPAFLMAMLEQQERLEAMTDLDEVEAVRAATATRRDALLEQVRAYFDDGQGTADDARAALAEGRYVARMMEQVKRKLQELD